MPEFVVGLVVGVVITFLVIFVAATRNNDEK